MFQSIMQPFYARTGVLVLSSHVLILLVMSLGGHSSVEKQSYSVLSGEIIELESAVSSKMVARQSTNLEQISKSNVTHKHVSPDGHEQLNLSQVHTATSAPISMPTVDSAALNNPKPPYPISSRENGEQGRVYLSACVNERGKIDRLDLAESSGFHALDRSALNTVRHWDFIPAHQNGKAIAICYRLPIHFVLSGHINQR